MKLDRQVVHLCDRVCFLGSVLLRKKNVEEVLHGQNVYVFLLRPIWLA
jgi:hypothetical protein